MKNHRLIASTIAGLSMAAITGAALAHSQGEKPMQTSCESRAGHHEKAQKRGSGMMQLPSAVIEKLNLTDTQKVALFNAQTASQAMRDGLRQAMREARKQGREAIASGQFDPRQMFEQQDARMQGRLAARQQIQQQWLGFWDTLSAEQQATVKSYMQSKAQSNKSDKDHKRS